MLFAQKCGKVFAQGVKPDVFGRDEYLVAGGFLTPACCTPDVDPVGGLVASAFVALVLHEGLQQHGLEAIAVLPVTWQAAGSQREDLGGQAFGLDPRQHQEARIVDHQLQVSLPLLFTPADVAFAVFKFLGAGAKADACYQLVTGKYVVTNLAARHGRVA